MRAVELTRTGNRGMMAPRDMRAEEYMRAWRIAKMCGQSVGSVMEWDAQDFFYVEAIENYIAAEHQKQAAARRKR